MGPGLKRRSHAIHHKFALSPTTSILGPVFFLIFITDLSDNLRSSVRLFAKDCPLQELMQRGFVAHADSKFHFHVKLWIHLGYRIKP